MEEWLHLVTKEIVIVIDAMALIIVTIGTAEAFLTGLWARFPPRHIAGSARSWCATGAGSSPASHLSSQPTSSRRRFTNLAGGSAAGGDCCDTNLSELFPRAGLGRAWEGS
jgi:hypothetical protein